MWANNCLNRKKRENLWGVSSRWVGVLRHSAPQAMRFFWWITKRLDCRKYQYPNIPISCSNILLHIPMMFLVPMPVP
jgi:hypothetical protein